MEKKLHFMGLMVSFFRESSPCPPDTSAALGTSGGGPPLAKEQRSKPATNEPPPLGPGPGRGLLALLVYFTLLVGGQGGLFAQSFPVQVIPQATPPAPIYLSDYADASTVTSPLRVQIILNDFGIANREIRLKTYFEGSGISFQSNDLVIGASRLFLEGGVPLVLTNVELAPYFQYENITGISPNVYGKAIPEGAYKFCFEVYDVLTGNRLSRKSCAISVVFQNEPPFLVLPINKQNVDEINPQNIVFQWTPRSINVTNVEYELNLVEIWDNQVDPQAVFLSSPPIFQVTTSATTYVYGPAAPLLLSGKNYAWRVQAKAKQGTEEIGLFKNQGYSEIFSFSYAGSCGLPLGVNHEVKGSTNANVFWEDFSTDVPEYTVRYRKAPSSSPSGGGNEWFLSKTTTNTLTLWGLKAGTSYEYQVRKKCTITESDWGIAKEFTTHIADDESSVYECGISPDINLGNKEPLPDIGTGDAFTAGDFPIKILEISGSNGRFTGKGYVTIPYLSSVRVGVEFTNVLINTDKQLAEGTVVTMYDPSLGNLLDVDEVIDTIDDVTDAVGELFEGDNDLDEMRVNFEIPKDKVKDIIKIKDGQVVITNPANGASVSEPLGDDKVVVDGTGQVYHIDTGGNITEGGQIDTGGAVNTGNVDGVSNNGDLRALTAKGIVITFEDTGKYGFDKMPASQKSRLKEYYTTVKDGNGNDYTIVHQAVKKGDNVTIIAKIAQTTADYKPSEIVFKTKQGEKIPTKIIGNDIELTLSGTYTFENELIYAVVPSKTDANKQLTAGAFRLWYLTERAVDVVLVSVNGASIPSSIATGVAGIFKKGVAAINITTVSQAKAGGNITLDASLLGGDNKLEIGDSPWLTAYNNEQKAVIGHLKAQIDYDKNTYYVLVFGNDVELTKSIAGFMPLQRQFGFVFKGNTNANEEGKGDLAKTVAHEIGHGVFALQHPFDQLGTQEGKTEWLMDYSNGALLNHLDWAQLHNPDLKFYVFQDEEDGQHGAYEYLLSEKVVPDLFKDHVPDFANNSQSATMSFVSSAGKIFAIPSSARDVTFSSKGTLRAFTILESGRQERYVSARWTTTGNFAGYLKQTGSSKNWEDNVYLDDFSRKEPQGQPLTVYTGAFENSGGICGIRLYSGKYPNTADRDKANNGGNKTPYVSRVSIQDKKAVSDTPVPSPDACSDLCDNGKKFFDTYVNSISSENEKQSLYKVAEIICKRGDEFYEALDSQIAKMKNDKINGYYANVFDKKLYEQALQIFWDRPDAWEIYANKLVEIKELYDNNSTLKDVNSDDLFFFLNYCGIDLLKQLSLVQKLDMLEYVLKNETFITDGTWLFFFSESKDEEGLIIKLLATIGSQDAKTFLDEILIRKVDKKNILTKLLQQIDDNFGKSHYTVLNQILFSLLIESEGGVEQYIKNHKDNIKVYPWLHDRTAWIFINRDIEYYHTMDDSGGLKFRADLVIQNEFRATDEDDEGNEIREKKVNCLSQDCSMDGIIDYQRSNKAKVYRFENFVPETVISNPYEVILIKFGSDLDLDGNPETIEISAGSILPVPAFFFKYALVKNDWTLLKRAGSDVTTIATSVFAVRTLVTSSVRAARIIASLTLFFNATNPILTNPNVVAWLEKSNEGQVFLIAYRTASLLSTLRGISSKKEAAAMLASLMSSYFKAEGGKYYGVIGKPFSKKFPDEFKKILEEINNLN